MSQRAPQTYGKLFLHISNLFSKYRPKKEKYSSEYQGVNIDKIAIS